MATLLTLREDAWYAWEMIPGYAGRYFSPIKVHSVEPLKTGRNLLRLRFHNACYAQGVQEFCQDLIVLHRSANYLVAKLDYGADSETDRCAIISTISEAWLARYRPTILARVKGLQADGVNDLGAALDRVC